MIFPIYDISDFFYDFYRTNRNDRKMIKNPGKS